MVVDRPRAPEGAARERGGPGQPRRARSPRRSAARGADGVNLDFEPIASGYADEFTALVRKVRAALDAAAPGYQLTFDTTGWIGNYPIEDATAKGGADAVVIMGYDYRSSCSSPVGSIAPIGGPTYDIRDTIRSVPRARARLEGHPRRAVLRARLVDVHEQARTRKNISGTKYGPSVDGRRTPTARDFAVKYGKAYDPVEGVAWTAYKRENCTTTYGCVKPWRQLYFDDAKALKAKYDLVNRLRPARRRDLGARLRRHAPRALRGDRGEVHHRHGPAGHQAGIDHVRGSSRPNGDGRLDTTTATLTATGLITWGYTVQPLTGRRSARPSGQERQPGRQGPVVHLGRHGTRTAGSSQRRLLSHHAVDGGRLGQPGRAVRSRSSWTGPRRPSRPPPRVATSRPTATATTTRSRWPGRPTRPLTGVVRLRELGRHDRPGLGLHEEDQLGDGLDGPDGRRGGRPGRSLHVPRRRPRPGRQPDRRRADGPRRPDDPARPLDGPLVRSTGHDRPSRVEVDVPAVRDDRRRHLPRRDAGPEDLDATGRWRPGRTAGHGPGRRLPVRTSSPGRTDRGDRDEQVRGHPLLEERDGPGPLNLIRPYTCRR